MHAESTFCLVSASEIIVSIVNQCSYKFETRTTFVSLCTLVTGKSIVIFIWHYALLFALI